MGLSSEQIDSIRMLRESAAAVADRADLSRIRQQRFRRPGFDRAVWKRMGELGWLGLRVPEEDGGSGLGMAEFTALAEEMGAALAVEPLIAGTMAIRLLHGDIRDAALAGDRIVLPAWQEHPQDIRAAGHRTDFRNGRISGHKVFIPLAAGADAFVVAAGSGLCVVAADGPGVAVEIVQAQDGTHWGTVTFDDAPATPTEGNLAAALDEAIVATSAYLLGVIDAALERTLSYLDTRTQFGAKIGSFQALQHRAVDLKLQAALTRASVGEAAEAIDGAQDRSAQSAAASRAKARASDAAMLVTRQAIQLHGGIGYTDEHDIGLFLRKAMVLAPWLGNSSVHRRRYAALCLGRGEPEDDAVQPNSFARSRDH